MDSDLLHIGKDTLRKEAEALTSFVDAIDETFEAASWKIFQCKGTVLVTGMGKSGLVARKWASTFASTGTKAYFINPAEAEHGDMGILHPDDLLIVLSLSGETQELKSVLRHAREYSIAVIAVTSKPESSITTQAAVVLTVSPTQEACPLGLAPTSSSTLMLALGDALAVTQMQMRGFKEEDFARLHPGGTLGRRLRIRVEELMNTGKALPIVHPDDPFDKVLLEMTAKCLGLAVVISQKQVLGVITDGDLRRFIQNQGARQTATAKDMMTLSPKKIPADALAVEARNKMEIHSVQQLLITDPHNTLVGVIHFHDLLRAKIL